MKATTQAQLTGNINASGTGTSSTFDVYDSLGAQHQLTVSFAPGTTANQWSWTATADGGTTSVGTGTVSFNANGQGTGSTGTCALALASGATTPQTIAMNFSSVTQQSATDGVQMENQDGLAQGTMNNYSIDSNGVITGSYTNGDSKVLGQIAVAKLPIPRG